MTSYWNAVALSCGILVDTVDIGRHDLLEIAFHIDGCVNTENNGVV